MAYRLLTFVQIVGVLILAAGVPAAFAHGEFATITVGYVVMRVALVTQWLRAAQGERSGRSAARRYAVAITLLQVGWVARLFVPHRAAEVAFYVLALAEMLVTAWAESGGRGTGGHRGGPLPVGHRRRAGADDPHGGAMGAVVVGLVVVDRMAPGLHRTLTRLNSADASRFPPA